MKIIKPAFVDSRGEIIDVVVGDNINHVNIITFTENSIRGNHYHKQTIQKNYLISGLVEYYEKDVENESSDVVKYTMTPGSITVSSPNHIHAFKSLAPSVMLVLTSGVRGGQDYENDTFRVILI